MNKENMIKFINESHPIAITFDTSFLERENYNFKNGNILKLDNLKKFNIKFILHNIVYEESKKHIVKKINEHLSAIKKSAKSIEYLNIGRVITFIGKTAERRIKNTDKYAQEILDNLIYSFNIEIIKNYYDGIVQHVFSRYFTRNPPFSNEKKEEFPDAFTLMSLENWSSQNSILIICISHDKDWEKYCECSDYLFCSKNIEYLFNTLFKEKIETEDKEHIYSIKYNIANFIKSKSDELTESISEVVDSIDNFYLEYESSRECECEINSITLKDYKIDSYDILSIDDEDDGDFTYNVSFNTSMNLDIEFSYEIYMYDSMDKEFLVMSSGYSTSNSNNEIDVSIKFRGCDARIVNIYNINILNPTIDIGGVELGDEFYGGYGEE